MHQPFAVQQQGRKQSSHRSQPRSITVVERALEMPPRDGIRELLRHMGRRHARKDKETGTATLNARYNVLINRLGELLESKPFKLQKLGNLGQHHLKAYILDLHEACEADRLARKTAANYLTPVRQLVTWMNKKGMFREISYYLPDVDDDYFSVQQECVVDKAIPWAFLDDIIARTEMLPDIRQRLIADVFRFMRATAARMEETVEADPHRDLLVLPDMESVRIYLSEGTKGGRPREFPSHNARAAEELRALLAKYELGRRIGALSPRDHPHEVKDRVYTVCQLVGFTKELCGYTPHTIRHGVAHEFYEERTGVPVAVKGGDPRRIDSELELKVRFELSSMLGHNRYNVAAYYGVLHSTSRRLHAAWENARRGGEVPGPQSPRFP